MTYTEKMLAEFDKKYVKDEEHPRFCGCLEGDLYDVWKDDIAELRAFLSSSITQAIAEERERARVVIDRKRKNILWEKHNRLDINADESKGYNKALDDLLSFLNNPDKQN